MQTQDLKVAIIGAGNMGSGIARGLAKGSLIKTSNICISDPNKEHLESIKKDFPEITISDSNYKIVQDANIVILAVKPWLIDSVVSEIQHKINHNDEILISIAAGIDLSQLASHFDTSNTTIFRLMPNIAIEIMEGVSALASLNATKEQEELILSIFNELGKTFLVPESQISAFMSLSSCGLAYAFRYIRAAIAGGVEIGIYPDMAKEAIIQTLRGAIGLLEANGSHPEAEIDRVTTPGGTTIRGLNEMEANGFTNAVIQGLKASTFKK